MHRTFLVLGAILAGLAVALGAFGAHGLQKLTADPEILHAFETGVKYQFYHSFGLLFVGSIFDRVPSAMLKWAALLFIAGIILFSGSLYLITLFSTREISYSFLGPITPIGGLCFITGWIFLVMSFLQLKKKP